MVLFLFVRIREVPEQVFQIENLVPGESFGPVGSLRCQVLGVALHSHPPTPENWGQGLSDLGTSLSPDYKGNKDSPDTWGCLGKRHTGKWKRQDSWTAHLSAPRSPV